ncbi:hypothetical protein [Hyphomonas sp.]|uniref:hypothetical protein n=1 Tax=Hyphomonas sp. TaxID=87 RepID=UPI00391B8C19
MKASHALSALIFPFALAACNPAPGTPEAPAPAPMPTPAAAIEAEPAAAPPLAEAGALTLTAFEPATAEIYCSFFAPGAGGPLGERLFITEIAGVPAPAAIGLEGAAVRLEEVSKTTADGAETWTYRNADRPVTVELNLTETSAEFETRGYEGTIRITAPEAGEPVAISGSCGV